MKKNIIILGILFVIALFIPFTVNNFILRFATDILIFAIMASAWNIIGGYTGYASFGNVVFFGIGAYVTALLMNLANMNFFLALVLSGIGGGIFGFIIGLPILRLSGHYFAIATLGVAEAMKALVQNMEITEGNSGLYLPMMDLSVNASYKFFYFTTLGVLVILLLITFLVLRSKLGYGFIAIREDEDAANSMGINTTLFKSISFAITGFFTSLAGSIYAYQQGFIKPEPVFNVLITVKMIVMAVFGGIGSLFGPLIGAASIEIISEFLSNYFLVAHTLFFGTIVIVAILFFPKGISDIFSFRKKIGIAYFFENIRQHRI
jgi:branched-chain amino acid transport system permease protein